MASIRSLADLSQVKQSLAKQQANHAAEEAARIVEKVRINPGNYADKKKFENFEYTELEYKAELLVQALAAPRAGRRPEASDRG